jgi:hypothetical protein
MHYDYTGRAVSLLNVSTFEKFEVLQYVMWYLQRVCAELSPQPDRISIEVHAVI